MGNMDSILTSIKKLLGIATDDTSFDMDIIIHINSVLLSLQQIGVGPTAGFYIEDDKATWLEFVSDRFLSEIIKSYVYIKVRLVFDPPARPTILGALQASADEYEWRITQHVANQ